MRFNVLLTSYEHVRGDKNVFKGIDWETVIIDEAHRLKVRLPKPFYAVSTCASFPAPMQCPPLHPSLLQCSVHLNSHSCSSVVSHVELCSVSICVGIDSGYEGEDGGYNW